MSSRAIQEKGYIYRFVEFHRAVELFQKRAIFFARPSLWHDPYEVRLQYKHPQAMFAQCWCQTGMTEAMWRIYSPTGTGVRIRTTKDKLSAAAGAWARARRYGYVDGIVDYQEPGPLARHYKDLETGLRSRFDIKAAAQSLLVKREAFRHENEWRSVIYCKDPGAQAAGIEVPVDPHELIDAIALDPRAPPQMVEALAFYLTSKIGFAGDVKVSALFKPPKAIVLD